MKILSFAGVCLCVLSVGCKDDPPPKEHQIAEQEASDGLDGDWNTADLAAVRKVATQFAQARIPGETVVGISSNYLDGTAFFVSVDTDIGPNPTTPTLHLMVRAFYKPGGGRYWRAEPITPRLALLLQYKQVVNAQNKAIEKHEEGMVDEGDAPDGP